MVAEEEKSCRRGNGSMPFAIAQKPDNINGFHANGILAARKGSNGTQNQLDSVPTRAQSSAGSATATTSSIEKRLRNNQEVLEAGRSTLLEFAEALAELSPNLDEAASKIASLRRLQERLSSETANLKSKAERLRGDRENLRSEVAALKAKAQRLREDRERLQSRLNTQQTEATKLRSATEQLRNQLATAESNAQSASQKLAQMEHSLRALTYENALNEFRSRYRKRERDRYREAFHSARYLVFKPRFLRQSKMQRHENGQLIERSGLFDTRWYVEQHPEAHQDPIGHFLWKGALEAANPHPLVDISWYLLTCTAARKSGDNPLIHYLTKGWKKKHSPHPLFDVQWYLNAYPEVAQQKIEPLGHYLAIGWKEGKEPHPAFDSEWYRRAYSLALNANDNPLIHYVTQGQRQGFQINSQADPTPAPAPPGIRYGEGHFKLATQPVGASPNVLPDSILPGSEESALKLRQRVQELEADMEQRFIEIAELTKKLEQYQTLQVSPPHRD